MNVLTAGTGHVVNLRARCCESHFSDVKLSLDPPTATVDG